MTREDMTSLINRLHWIWNSHDYAAIPDVYSEDFVGHWSKSYSQPQSCGHSGIEAFLRETLTAFPDWHETVVDLIIDGDRIVTRFMATGTHQGLLGDLEPTGRQIEVEEISIFRVAGGKVAEQWGLADDLALLRQLGQ